MSKVAFMFPGQGSFEAGMGRDVALAVPEAMAVFDAGSAASGLDLKQLCFEGTAEQLVETELQQPALVATSLALNAALRARGIVPDFVVGHSVGEFAALSAAESITPAAAIALVRERGLAMAAAARERPGSMAAILGLADEVVETLCRKIVGVWPANYNCPGRSSSRARTARSASAAKRPSARAPSARSSSASPARSTRRSLRERRTGFAPRSRRSTSPRPRRRSCRRSPRRSRRSQRYRTLLVDQLTAPVRFTQAARALIGSGVTVFVEVGPGNVLSGLLKRIDRSVKTFSVNDLKALDEVTEALRA